MSPRALSRYPDAEILNGADRVVTLWPRIAAIAVEHIGIWSYIEHTRENLLTACLMDRSDLVHTLLSEVTSPGARDSVLRNALKIGVRSEADREMIRSVWVGAIDPAEAMRDKYAHHLWAASTSIPDSLILIDSRKLAALSARNLCQRIVTDGLAEYRGAGMVYEERYLKGELKAARNASVLALATALFVASAPNGACERARELLSQAQAKLPKKRPRSS